MISESRQRLKYLIGDYLSSCLAWFVINCIRFDYGMVTGYSELEEFLLSRMVLVGELVAPLIMMAVYWLSGYYNNVFRKSRLHELLVTAYCAFVNTLILFFTALIDDVQAQRVLDYEIILMMFVTLFATVYVVRFFITNDTMRRIKDGEWKFRVLIIGRGASAVAFANKMLSHRPALGYDVVGFASIPGENDVKEVNLPTCPLDEVESFCRQHHVQEIIVAPTRQSSSAVLKTINHLFMLGLPIKVTPDRNNVLLSQVRITDVYGLPLVDISGSNMSESEKNVKRTIDVVVSALMLVLLSPVYALVALLVKLDSHGPVFYRQERVGYHNVPFMIVKFRTMVDNAEADEKPRLTTDDDPRVTRIGRFMRKYRIDELPQFWNILKGEMSLVGPRPERQFFIDQIIKQVPSYALIHQVRPGLTSLGMVKFGYAQNIDEMIERLEYDLLYLENMSLVNDFKILVYTIKIVFTGRGM